MSLRLEDIWAWLPAFRAVAESGSLSAAAKRLHVSPSALSRSIRLLEGSIGQDLFVRNGRGVELTDRGRVLADELLDAMSRLSASFNAMETEGKRPLRIASQGLLARTLVLPALSKLKAAGFPIDPVLVGDLSVRDAEEQMAQGALDLLIAINPETNAAFARAELGANPMGIYIGKGHRYFEESDVQLGLLLDQPFVAQPPRAGARPVWPKSFHRSIELSVHTHHLGLEACLSGSFAMVMSKAAGRPLEEAGWVRGITPPELAGPTIEAMYRPSDSAALAPLISVLKDTQCSHAL